MSVFVELGRGAAPSGNNFISAQRLVFRASWAGCIPVSPETGSKMRWKGEGGLFRRPFLKSILASSSDIFCNMFAH
jgi:hypothetical protein